MIYVTRPSMPDFEEYCEEIKKIWNSKWLTNMGEEHEVLQKKLEEYLGCSDVVLFVNGHLALESVIAAMNFPDGSEVITTPFTFASTPHAIVRNGLIPVFCDINPENYTMDVDKIEELITEKTVAIVPVHVYGNVCDVERIDAIAKKYNLKVIYDAAHAFSIKYKGVSVARFGDASIFSFHATKVFNTIEGGAVCLPDDSYVDTLNNLKNYGIRDEENIVAVGGNAKMNEFQAAMGICNLKHIDEEISKRKVLHDRYVERLETVQGVKMCKLQKEVEYNYSYFPVVFDGFSCSRDDVFDVLYENGICARKYFYPLVSDYQCYNNYQMSFQKNTPVAKYISERVITLPLYSELSLGEVDKICGIITRIGSK
ncbi:MAG: DegT/DnrJ/EryC1/StrS family aminotransferase [Lachnospiraceae bacterium]|nr:DegT/DnrJ/EryC1/StrS family aminotransferase [Lachnospiraceae bacterium]